MLNADAVGVGLVECKALKEAPVASINPW